MRCVKNTIMPLNYYYYYYFFLKKKKFLEIHNQVSRGSQAVETYGASSHGTVKPMILLLLLLF
jgi:hypothetical protein